MFRELPEYEFPTLEGSRAQLPLEKLTVLRPCFPGIPPLFTRSGASLQILSLKLQNGTRRWDSKEFVLVVAVVVLECGSRAQCSVCACLEGRGPCVLIGLCQWPDFYVVLAVPLPLFSKPGSPAFLEDLRAITFLSYNP